MKDYIMINAHYAQYVLYDIENKSKVTEVRIYFITIDGHKCSNIPINETTQFSWKLENRFIENSSITFTLCTE